MGLVFLFSLGLLFFYKAGFLPLCCALFSGVDGTRSQEASRTSLRPRPRRSFLSRSPLTEGQLVILGRRVVFPFFGSVSGVLFFSEAPLLRRVRAPTDVALGRLRAGFPSNDPPPSTLEEVVGLSPPPVRRPEPPKWAILVGVPLSPRCRLVPCFSKNVFFPGKSMSFCPPFFPLNQDSINRPFFL